MFTIYCTHLARNVSSVGEPPSVINSDFANSRNPNLALFAVMTHPAIDLRRFGHEIGHLLGLSHPWSTAGLYSEERLPDDIRGRIMGYDRTGTRLVKPERDVIHQNVADLLTRLPQ